VGRYEAKKWRPDITPVVLSERGSFHYPDAAALFPSGSAQVIQTSQSRRTKFVYQSKTE